MLKGRIVNTCLFLKKPRKFTMKISLMFYISNKCKQIFLSSQITLIGVYVGIEKGMLYLLL